LLRIIAYKFASVLHHRDLRVVATPSESFLRMWQSLGELHDKSMPKQPILLTEEIVPPPALIRAGLEALPAIIRAQGERASHRFIEFFTATIRNRNTRAAYARAVKQFFDWCDEQGLDLRAIGSITVAAYVEQLGNRASKPTV
jgi:hypothetical protein